LERQERMDETNKEREEQRRTNVTTKERDRKI